MFSKRLYLTIYILLYICVANSIWSQTYPVNPYEQDQTSANMVVFEAEHYHYQEITGEKKWEFLSIADEPGASGVGSVIILPNNNSRYDYPDDYNVLSSRLDYHIYFHTAGTYYVWVRGLANGSGADDSFHTGIDGQSDEILNSVTLSGCSDWEWTNVQNGSGGRIQFTIQTPGIHAFNIWMREDGTILDKFIITTDAAFVPAGGGQTVSQPYYSVANQLSLQVNDLEMIQGDTYINYCNWLPEGSTPLLYWYSDDESIATVSANDGTITAIYPGSTIIHVIDIYTNVHASCNITVYCNPSFVFDCTNIPGIITDAYGENLYWNEGKENTIDNNITTKWSDFNSNTWISYQFPNNAAHVITQYSITSANNIPERDPKNWFFKGSHDGAIWIDIDVRTDEYFSDRFETRNFSCSNTTAYEFYRFDFEANSASVFQVAEIELFEQILNCIRPVSGVDLNISQATMYKGNQLQLFPVFEIPGEEQAVTWTSDNEDVLHVDENGLVTALNMGTATITMTTIDGPYYIRTCIITVECNTMDIDWTNVTQGLISFSSEFYDGPFDERAINAFDNNILTKWHDPDNSLAWISYQFNDNNMHRINKYSITCANDGHTRDPEDWTLYGSYDGINWIPLDTRTNEVFQNEYETKTYYFSNSEYFNIYKFELSNSGGRVQLAEIELNEQPGNCIIPVTGLEIVETSIELLEETTQDLTFSVTPIDATNNTPNWSSSAPLIAEVDANGQVTAISPGTATITASSIDVPVVTDDCIVTVLPRLRQINLEHVSLDLNPEDESAIGITLFPADAHNNEISWSSDYPDIVSVQIIEGEAWVTAHQEGSAVITATPVDAPDVDPQSCAVIVSAIDVTSVAIDNIEETLDLNPLVPRQLTVTVLPENATYKAVTWSSLNPGIATVDAEGNISTISLGTATIVASSVSNPDISDEYTFEIVPVPATSVNITNTETELVIDQTLQLETEFTPTNTTDKSLTWEVVSGTYFVDVDAAGLITPKQLGAATIQCTTSNELVDDITISVVPIAVLSFTAEVPATMATGEIFTIRPDYLPIGAQPVDALYESDYPAYLLAETNTSDFTGQLTALQAIDNAKLTITINSLAPQDYFVDIIDGMYGDANLDAILMAYDAGIILQSVINTEPDGLERWGVTQEMYSSDTWEFLMDVNKNLEVDVMDAFFVMQAVIGKTVLPVPPGETKSKIKPEVRLLAKDGYLYISADNELLALHMDIKTTGGITLYEPEVFLEQSLMAVNNTGESMGLAMLPNNENTGQQDIIRIPFSGAQGSIQVDMRANSYQRNETICINAVNGTLAVPEVEKLQCTVYPNPAHGQVTFEINRPCKGGFKVQLFDITGKCIKTLKGGGNRMTIDIEGSNLANGMYQYSVHMNNGSVINGKLIVE